jgi:hypothetical protein
MAFVALFCTKESLQYLEEQKRYPRLLSWLRVLYPLLGIFMILAPLAAIGVTWFFGLNDVRLFAVETAGVIVFSAYWALKSLELYLSRAEHLAVLGLNPSQAGKIAAMSAEADAFKNMAAMGLQQKLIEVSKQMPTTDERPAEKASSSQGISPTGIR